jgi:hypothetical protein
MRTSIVGGMVLVLPFSVCGHARSEPGRAKQRQGESENRKIREAFPHSDE